MSLADVGSTSSPALADLDGDGDLDALIGERQGNTLFFENTGSATVPAFAAPQTNPFGLADVGTRSRPAMADLDGDGDLDALIGNDDGNTLFFENTGSATVPAFAAPQTNPFGLADVGRYNSPVLADLDGDGDLDALIGERLGDTLFFENTGSATAPAFAAPQTNPFGLAVVGELSSPALGDLDGDGDLDALIGERYGTTLFFENTGSGTAPAFAAPQMGLTDVGFQSRPALGDLDGDGDLDALIGNAYGNTIFFENMGSGAAPAFAAPQTNPFGLADVGSYSSPALADLDGDGDLDALIGEEFGNTLFFENTGSATAPAFAAPLTNPFGLADVGSRDTSPALADLDGDGDLDALIGNDDGNEVFFENTGSATAPAFAAPRTNPFGLTNLHNDYFDTSPALADLDGDGDLDALIGDEYGTTLFFENTGSATAPAFAAPQSFGLTDVGSFSKPALGDLDGDGDLDALIGNADGDTIFFENGCATPPAFAAPQTNPFGLADVGFFSAPALADLDGDGDLDAWIGEDFGNTFFFENTGSATAPAFAAPQTNPFGLADVGDSSSPALADLDADGDLDALIEEIRGDTFFFENTGSATAPAFAAPQTNPFGLADVGSYSSPALADLDGDGDLDALIGELFGDTFLFENTGSVRVPAFAAPQTNPFGLANVGFSSAPALADLDGDGDLDAWIGEFYGNTLFFANTGSATAPAFAAPQTNPFGLADAGTYSSPAFADLDGDGDLDALIGELYGNTLFFENQPPGDADGDGIPDAGAAPCQPGQRVGCADNCPFEPNNSGDDIQRDSNQDGRGDACECGNADKNEKVDIFDALHIAQGTLSPPLVEMIHPRACDADGNGSCDIFDALRVAQATLTPPLDEIVQECEAATKKP